MIPLPENTKNKKNRCWSLILTSVWWKTTAALCSHTVWICLRVGATQIKCPTIYSDYSDMPTGKRRILETKRNSLSFPWRWGGSVARSQLTWAAIISPPEGISFKIMFFKLSLRFVGEQHLFFIFHLIFYRCTKTVNSTAVYDHKKIHHCAACSGLLPWRLF